MEKRAIFVIIIVATVVAATKFIMICGVSAMAATNFLRGKIVGVKAAVLLLLIVSLIIFLIGIFSLIYIFIKKLRGE